MYRKQNRSPEGIKARNKYINKYTNENYKTFGAKLRIEEYDEIKELLKHKGMTNADFIRYALEKLRSF